LTSYIQWILFHLMLTMVHVLLPFWPVWKYSLFKAIIHNSSFFLPRSERNISHWRCTFPFQSSSQQLSKTNTSIYYAAATATHVPSHFLPSTIPLGWPCKYISVDKAKKKRELKLLCA
jgi:hypothetical protein